MAMKTPKGFTLIELLVVISIIALLLSILTPALSMAKEKARRLVCSANLKSMGTGLHFYTGDYDEKAIPMANLDGKETYDLDGKNILPWFGYVVGEDVDDPYLKAVNLGKLFSEQIVEVPDIFYCPTAAKSDEDDKYNLETYTTDIEKYMPKGDGQWGSPLDPVVAGRCRINYVYWTWNENTYNSLSLRPVVVDRLTSYKRIAHKKGDEPYGINALFGDGHVNMTLLRNDKKLLNLIEDAKWDDIARDRDVFTRTLRLLDP
jgi:prepilin-type N-terminal cleavage/methylation domain-containing protein/prepilin-type processing-associated H-X9-DG protein